MIKPKKQTKRRKGQFDSKAMSAVLMKPRMDCKAWPSCACILRGNYKRDCMDLRCP